MEESAQDALIEKEIDTFLNASAGRKCAKAKSASKPAAPQALQRRLWTLVASD